MRSERGAIEVITIVGILLVIIVILVGIIVFYKIERKGEEDNTNTYQENKTRCEEGNNKCRFIRISNKIFTIRKWVWK